MKDIIILGSTGSVGRSAFDICMKYPEKFKIKTLVCNENFDEIVRQIKTGKPTSVAIRNELVAKKITDLNLDVVVLSGDDGIIEAIHGHHHNIAITAITGIDGLRPTIEVTKHCDTVAFVNKETIIYAGELFLETAAKYNTKIIPVDSEHSAIFQLLEGHQNTKKIILTASGGPLWNKERIYDASVEEVLAHPTWKMGQKISVDCATMINKGLEVIEAVYLFNKSFDDISVLVHPESVVHGMIELEDNSIIMHASPSDMKLAIAYAMSWPERITGVTEKLDLIKISKLNFFPPNHKKFPMMQLAIDAAKNGTVMRIAMNIANEIAVKMFLDGRIKYGELYEIVSDILNKINIKYQETNDIAAHVKQVEMICVEVKFLMKI